MIKPYIKNKWITKYDEILDIVHMKTSHIENTINFLKSHRDFYNEVGGIWCDPKTFYYEDNSYLVDKKIEELTNELKRRQNMEHSWNDAKFDFRGIPTKCSNCGSTKIRYTSNAEIYHGKQYGNGYCYLCDDCGASVGVRDTKSKLPLGRFATRELKDLKMECHKMFDDYWRSKKFKRTDCYGYVANKLGLMLRETHFGWFDKEYLLKSIDILRNTTEEDIREYIEERESKD